MENFNFYKDKVGNQKIDVPLRGNALIRHPLFNKGSAFTAEERETFGLQGMLPSAQNSMELQLRRVYASINQKPTALDKYIGLAALQDRNEHLYYRLLCNHLEEFMPIVYTPTVGLATRNFSQVFRRARGIWITPDFRGRIASVLESAIEFKEVRLLVVTDNESILGIGDQGAGGMAISVGKLALYCAGAGIHPTQTLPISLDVGTNNPTLLEDEFYLGWREQRLTGEDYDSLIAEFVEAVQQVLPGALIQWEDFRKNNALRILEAYRDTTLSFNDDIQGTGAVALAAVLTSARVTNVPLRDQRIVIFGAGAAGLGIARQLRAAMTERGMSEDQLRRAVAVLDSRGLLVDDRPMREEYKRELAWPAALAEKEGLGQDRSLAAVVKAYRPTVLIGSAGQAGAFTEEIVTTMARHVERPVILPFSNPTDYAEAAPMSLIRWTEGRALVATGSPFDDVSYDGRRIRIGQGNNVFIFPGLGLGALLVKASRVTDGMITAASRALAAAVTSEELESGLLFPAISRLGGVSKQVAAAVVKSAVEEGAAGVLFDENAIVPALERVIWSPDYPEFVPV